MLFQMTDFTVDKSDFLSVGVSYKNGVNDNKSLTYYVLTEAIKLEPVDKIPSFYMVNKYGEVYDDTQYILVPYIRFMIADPKLNYADNKTNWASEAEMHRTDYRANPFHPYWIGGVSYNGMSASLPNPNQNAFENSKELWDAYVIGDQTRSECLIHGIRNQNTKIPKLMGIGEDLVPNEGGLKQGMFLPAGARYMQAGVNGSFTGGTNTHFLRLVQTADFNVITSTYRYLLSLPELSTSAVTPYILPPLFTDLFCWFNNAALDRATNYNYDTFAGNAVSVLTFGVQRA